MISSLSNQLCFALKLVAVVDFFHFWIESADDVMFC